MCAPVATGNAPGSRRPAENVRRRGGGGVAPREVIDRIDNVDTAIHGTVMAKTVPTGSSRVATSSVVARAASSDAKGSINLRIENEIRQIIDEAAAVLGKTRTEFMVESARRQAVDVLLDQRLFMLDPDRYDAFVQALDNPPAPGPRLGALLRRAPAWQK